jgi:two-component system, sensor histidine kinase RegB
MWSGTNCVTQQSLREIMNPMAYFQPDQDIIANAIANNAPFVGRLRSRTLVGSRWAALLGQLITILIVHFALKFELPLLLCILAIGANAALNLYLSLAQPFGRLVRQWEAAAQLTFDVLQLSFLLFLTGGIENPFCLLLIAPVTVSASTLRPKWTIGLIGVTLICVTALTLTPYPLPWNPVGGFDLPGTYRFAVAIAIGIGLLFTAGYAWRVSVEEGRLADALIATQEILAREQRLAALGGLAAAAAHELGTPLATIQVTAKELARSLPQGSLDHEDAKLVLSQAQRCREILRKLSDNREISDPTAQHLPLGQLLQEAAARHPDHGTKALLFDIVRPNDGPDLIVIRQPAILYGLGNLIENALEFSTQAVTISALWDVNRVQISIGDDGPGFDESVLERLGEPYVTTRGPGNAGPRQREGMGLGFFIAKTLLERSGAKVSVSNQSHPLRGAIIKAVWPRQALEAS